MKTLYTKIICICFICVAVSVIIMHYVLITAEQPELVTSDVHIGSYKAGSSIFCNLSIMNNGNKSLKIYSVKACCGTHIVNSYPKTIKPKSTDSFLVNVATTFGKKN